MIRLSAGAASLALVAAPCAAAPDASAYEAYTRGDYLKAADIAAAAGGAENWTMAAIALNAVAYFEPDKKAARLVADRAHDLAARAIAADPSLADAQVQAAVSLLLKSARMSGLSALMSGNAGEARKRLDAALALAPDHPLALSTSASWRIEVTRRGGGALKGADPNRGFDEFQRARAIAPGDAIVAHECALRLLADGRTIWRAPALACLDGALAAAPSRQFEKDVQQVSRALKAAVEAGPKAEKAFIAKQP